MSAAVRAPLRLASAPVTWGVWEATIGRDDLIPPKLMLEAVRDLGYGGIELGPFGYFGDDAAAVGASLEPYGVVLAGAFVELHLADPDAFERDLPELERTLDVLAALGSPPALLADAGSPERHVATGRPDELRRTALDGAALDRAAERAMRAAERCRERGVAAAFHFHAATYFESPAEIEALIERTDPALLEACFDTGHVLVGGGDPLELMRACGPRTTHVHLKDVDGGVLARVRAGKLDIDSAWEQGLFCPFGEGEVDLAGFLGLPEMAGFPGWAVLEQDRVAVRVADLERTRAVEERNRALVLEWSARAGAPEATSEGGSS